MLRLCRNQWDRAAALVLVVAGVGGIVTAWIGTSGTVFAFEQIPWVVSGGLLGTCAVFIGVGLWLSADLRDEWRKLDRLEEAVLGRVIDGPTVQIPEADHPQSSESRPALRMSGV